MSSHVDADLQMSTASTDRPSLLEKGKKVVKDAVGIDTNLSKYGITSITSVAVVVPDDTVDLAVAKQEMLRLIANVAASMGKTGKDDSVTNHIMEGICLALAVNGTSARAPYRNMVTTGSGNFAGSLIADGLAGNMRRVGRAYADLIRAYLCVNPAAAKKCVERFGYAEHAELSFDCAMYCSGLSMDTKLKLSELASAKLSRSTPYDGSKQRTKTDTKPVVAHFDDSAPVDQSVLRLTSRKNGNPLG